MKPDSNRWSSCRAGVVLSAILTVAACPIQAQEAAGTQQGFAEGWYVVRPGDTLEDISLRFLGNSQLWRLHLPLNIHVRNPNLVYPGQDLRIAGKGEGGDPGGGGLTRWRTAGPP